MKIHSVECPNCGASLSYKQGETGGVCPYCGSVWAAEKDPDQIEQESYAAESGRLRAEEEAANRREKAAAEKSRKKKAVFLVILAAGIVIVCLYKHVRKMNLPEIDPFENLSVTFSGLDGEGVVTYKSTGNGDLSAMKFDVSKEDALSNGDVITFTAEDLEGYRFSRSAAEYDVTGLDEYLSSYDRLPEDVQERIHSASLAALQTENRSDMNMFPEGTYWSEPEYIGQYLLVAKEGYDNWHGMNRLYDLYHSVITTDDGEDYDIYQPMMFEDIIVKGDGSISMDYSCTLEADWHMGDDIGMGITAIFEGYLSEEEMYYGVISGNEGNYTVYVAEGTNTF